MDMITNFYRRACDESDPNSPACDKPTSKVLLNAVPAAIVGVMLLVAGIVFFIIARKRRQQFIAEEAKERESFEIEIYEPTANNRNRNPTYADPFNDPHGLSRDPDYNEFSLAAPQSRRDHSPSKSSIATESTYIPHSEMSAPPPAYQEGSVGASVERWGITTVLIGQSAVDARVDDDVKESQHNNYSMGTKSPNYFLPLVSSANALSAGTVFSLIPLSHINLPLLLGLRYHTTNMAA
ncbi:hypothetical protein EYB25_002499 [Talaromyces marneffei]|nr:hypothetical protein EYB25_002499 [Talaromyces marneffei]